MLRRTIFIDFNFTYLLERLIIVESGLKFSFDVKTTLMISEIAFYPSRTTHGYDLYASAADKEDILFLNLSNGKRNDIIILSQ